LYKFQENKITYIVQISGNKITYIVQISGNKITYIVQISGNKITYIAHISGKQNNIHCLWQDEEVDVDMPLKKKHWFQLPSFDVGHMFGQGRVSVLHSV
jgi:hypothetical protein